MPGAAKNKHLQVENHGDITVVHFTDKKILDKPNIQEIGDQLYHLVDTLGRIRLLLDFGMVEYLSSAALGKLITLEKKLTALGGWLVLANIKAKIMEIFRISKLDRVFEIHQQDESDPDAGLARILAALQTRSADGSS